MNFAQQGTSVRGLYDAEEISSTHRVCARLVTTSSLPSAIHIPDVSARVLLKQLKDACRGIDCEQLFTGRHKWWLPYLENIRGKHLRTAHLEGIACLLDDAGTYQTVHGLAENIAAFVWTIGYLSPEARKKLYLSSVPDRTHKGRYYPNGKAQILTFDGNKRAFLFSEGDSEMQIDGFLSFQLISP